MNIRHRPRAQLFLMEFLVVLLLFALCSAVCLSAFVRAERISRDSAAANQALALAQSVAEEIKAAGGAAAGDEEGFDRGDFHVQIRQTVEDQLLVATVTVSPREQTHRSLCQIQVKKYLPEEPYGNNR